MTEPIDPGVDIGHVHLKVADLDRAIGFYRDVLGFELQQRLGDQAAFLSAGGYHHHIGLNTWESRGGSPPPPRHDRSLPRRDPLSDAEARSPTRSGASERRASRSTAPPTTVSARRSICATRTGTGSSSTGTARRTNGREAPTAGWRCSRPRSTCAASRPSSTAERRRQPRFRTTVFSSVKASMAWRPPTRPTPLFEPARPPKGRWLSQ